MKERLVRLRAKMSEKGHEALLISHPVNRRYITGFTGTAGMALVTDRDAVLVTDFRYVTQVKQQSPHFEVYRHDGDIFQAVADLCRKRGLKSLAFEQDHLTYGEVEKLKKSLGDIIAVPTSRVVESLRAVKDEGERDAIRKAAAIADRAFERILEELRPGRTEREIALRLEFMMREMGADGASFDIIVASGPRSALPHGVASDRVLEEGDLVTLDFGASYRGYCSDITRTVVLGEPNDAQRRIYETVREAQQAAVDAIRPGMTGKEADRVARDRIKASGYEKYFGHGTGHGLGMEVHEAPRLSPRGEEILEPGMVVTVEPGIYLPEFGGVRIEDDVIVTEDGREVLTQSPKHLIVIQ
ncbi:MAG: Xaa-Pro dipeptidase [Thermoactinomycetaceae bacterium]|nr:Xaa-Pro dipeptidase [Thermoactinomycetaceae bacterium]